MVAARTVGWEGGILDGSVLFGSQLVHRIETESDCWIEKEERYLCSSHTAIFDWHLFWSGSRSLDVLEALLRDDRLLLGHGDINAIETQAICFLFSWWLWKTERWLDFVDFNANQGPTKLLLAVLRHRRKPLFASCTAAIFEMCLEWMVISQH